MERYYTVAMLEAVPVAASSNIKEAFYDLDTQTLLVSFNRGAIYSYSQVPGEVATDFGKALSAGEFFAQNIKGKFDYKKVAG